MLKLLATLVFAIVAVYFAVRVDPAAAETDREAYLRQAQRANCMTLCGAKLKNCERYKAEQLCVFDWNKCRGRCMMSFAAPAPPKEQIKKKRCVRYGMTMDGERRCVQYAFD